MVPEIWIATDNFLPFYNLANQNFEKMKKSPRDINILHKCTINENKHDRQNFLSFWTTFALSSPPSPLTTWKMKILKK